MYSTRFLPGWILLILSSLVPLLILILVTCQKGSREWILDHESELPPRIPPILDHGSGHMENNSSLLEQGIPCADNGLCCNLPTWRLVEFQVVFKMGASEPMEQIYTNLNHTSKCNPNVLVVRST